MQTATSHEGGVAVMDDARRTKEVLRERIRGERRRRVPAEREASARALAAIALETPEISAARSVATYVSTATAPGTLPLRRALISSGVQVLLPVLLDDGGINWSTDGNDVVASPAPDVIDLSAFDPSRAAPAEVLLVPALAVDTLGNRLGHGSGFYDRVLQTVDPAVPVFAVAFEDEVLDAAVETVPTEPHDRPVDAIITPHRCLRLVSADVGHARWGRRTSPRVRWCGEP
ncbi:MAG: 5-formyltetrahydrofolate cyclo-ligase [Actinomycetota bacterium]|nr:5-formyltetrahydrofolate cyclo-ligase [Actinomycetota bacterium]